MIDRIIIYADTTWSVGELDATLRGVVSAESLRSDARTGSENDGVAIEAPLTIASHFDPPPLGAQCDVVQDGETIASGTITEIAITESVRMQVDL